MTLKDWMDENYFFMAERGEDDIMPYDFYDEDGNMIEVSSYRDDQENYEFIRFEPGDYKACRYGKLFVKKIKPDLS